MGDKVLQTLHDGNVVLYVRDGSKKGNISYRIRVPGEKNQYERKSTDTPNLIDAAAKANARYLQLSYRKAQGMPVFEHSFKKLAEAYLEALEGRKVAGEISSERYRLLCGIINNNLLPFFKDYAISAIGTDDLRKYHKWRIEQYEALKAKGQIVRNKRKVSTSGLKPPSPFTQSRDESIFLTMMGWALERHWIEHNAFPVIDRTNYEGDGKRGAFSDTEVKTIFDYLSRRTGENRLRPRDAYCRKMVYQYCKLLLLSGLRPSEGMVLRFRDVTELRNANGHDYTKIYVRAVEENAQKTGAREVIVFAEVKEVLAFIRSFHPDPQSDHFLFPVWNKEEKYEDQHFKSFSKAVSKALTELGLHIGEDGLERTAYSFRHTYITNRILARQNLAEIALNCGTSVAMIEKHYSHVIKELNADRYVA